MKHSKFKICALLLSALLLLTSCTQESGNSSSQILSSVPDSSAPSSKEPVSSATSSGQPVVSLTFDPVWNHHTVCEFAYIDADNKLHISPEYRAYVAAAKQYHGKTGAVSVVCLDDEYSDELWILWEDHTVTYLHPTMKEMTSKYPQIKDANPAELNALIKPDECEAHWARIEKRLRGKKVAWIFGESWDAYESHFYYGFADTQGVVCYYEDEKATFSESGEDQLIYAQNGVMLSENGAAYCVTRSREGYQRTKLVEKDAVLVNTTHCGLSVCLMEDGSLQFFGEETTYGSAMNTETVAVRLFPGTLKMLCADGRIVPWCGIDFPNHEEVLEFQKDGKIDQLYVGIAIIAVFSDGTIECSDTNHWLHGVTDVKVLGE